MLALALAAAVTFVSGDRAWLIEPRGDGLYLQWDTSGTMPTIAEAIAAAQAYLDRERHGCKAVDGGSNRVPGYSVRIECRKQTRTPAPAN